MSSVLIFGATGFIGNAVAKEFQRKGYRVYGLVRTEDKAKILRKQEIIPVIAKAQDTKVWEPIANKVNIIIEALADFQDYSTGPTVQKTLLEISSKHKDKIIIYTSGVWVYGSTSETTDENSNVNPPDLVKSRPAFEKVYTESNAIVLRPGVVYGHEGSLTGSLFKNLKEGKGEFPGHANNLPHWAAVHVDDLADAYVRAAERGASLRGQTINLVSHIETVSDVLQNIAKITGYKGEIKFVEPKDPFSICLALSQKHIVSKKAKILLDWNPKQTPLSVNTEKYFRSWEAFN